MAARNEEDPVQLSPVQRLILEMLILNGGEMYGLELVSESGGRLKRGTVYVTLDRMEDKGYIESRKEPKQPNERGLPKRRYKPTGLGQRVLSYWELSNSRGGLSHG